MEDRNEKGRFKKGHNGYKPKGAVTKKTAFIKIFTNYLIEEQGEKFKEELNKLSPKEYVQTYLGLLKIANMGRGLTFDESLSAMKLVEEKLLEKLRNKNKLQKL